ncbi:hypothetical protein ACNKHR_09455 [Shigella flexneri]
MNGRMMRDRLMDHAIRQACEDKLGADQQPAFCAVSGDRSASGGRQRAPAKHEVRFHQSRLVHDFIYQGVLSVLTEATWKRRYRWTMNPNLHRVPFRKTAWRRGAITLQDRQLVSR